MEFKELSLPGVHLVTPKQLPDRRGAFFEGLRADLLGEAIGHPFEPKQINYSVSGRNTLRGLHSVTTPPGQAKYVTCVRGAVLDFVVDLRIGSPTFGRHESRELIPETGLAVYIPDGLSHGFVALTDDTCLCYVLSTTYVPGTQIAVDPWDPALDLPWPLDASSAIMSDQDIEAPSVAEAEKAGLLSRYEDVR